MKYYVPLVSAVSALALCGCISDRDRVRNHVERLVNQNLFDDARVAKGYDIAHNPGGIPKTDDEDELEKLTLSLINPREKAFIARRTRELKDKVMADLAKNDDAAARKCIYEFGVHADVYSLQPTVNEATFLMKCGLLNSRVNPATYSRMKKFAAEKVLPAIKSGDYAKATALIAEIKPVAAYPGVIDELLDKTGNEAIEQRCRAEEVLNLLAGTKEAIYAEIANRTGSEKTDYVPDWGKVGDLLQKMRDKLVADDVPPTEADAMKEMLLSGIQALFNDEATDENLTTAELNARLASLRADLRNNVSNAIYAKMANAAAEEAERLRKLAMDAAAAAAAEVNMEARIGAFVGAIGGLSEPDMNRVLGDGAKVLRLYCAGEKISSADATSLFVAGTYMGFGDVMNLALALGADINGASSKDTCGRPAYLVGLQYGFKNGTQEILAKADRSVRDASGYGAVHYAVRYATPKTVLELLQAKLDARTAAKDGVTPLMLAASLDNLALVQTLVGFSDINAADAEGCTALLHAAKCGSLQSVKALLAANADLAAKAKSGDTALDFAVALPEEKLIAYLLDEKKVAPTERSVAYCVINGKVLPLTTLIAHGGKVTDKHLAAAVASKHLDMVKYLVSLGRDVNADVVRNQIGGTTAEIAAFLKANGFRDEPSVKSLLPAGVVRFE